MKRGATEAGLGEIMGGRAVIWISVFAIMGVLACVMPDNPGAFNTDSFLRLPVEVPLVALGLMLLPRRLGGVLAILVTIVVFALMFLKIADIGVISAFQRQFNPYLDIKMMFDGWNLLSGSAGTLSASLAVGLAVASLAGLMLLFWRACIQMTRLGGSIRRTAVAGFAILAAVGLGLVAAGLQPLAEMRVAAYLSARIALVGRSVADIRAFEGQLAAKRDQGASDDLFSRIRGRDVILVFVESYGRSAIEDPRYGGLIRPRLASIEDKLKAAGLSAASGWARSPTVGGISWLAHGTLLSGLWIDSQARYDLLMASDRASLNRLFRDAGWQTTAVMPAITMDWPEAAYFGYDQILAARDLGYRGQPFNWVTMPDQYSLSAFERLSRRPAHDAGKPVMAEIALISSHAPWTPVPKLIDWEAVGDGTVFNAQANSGDPPQVVWADPDRVRRQYVETIDYTLETLGDYMARFGRDAVFVVLGDHQPAALVTGPDASRAVPIHIVSRDATLIEGFRSQGFAIGMTPDPEGSETSMDRIGEDLIRQFSGR